MCGIVAYIGDRQAYPIVLSGLKRLEYRGYDSAGVAVLKNGNINVDNSIEVDIKRNVFLSKADDSNVKIDNVKQGKVNNKVNKLRALRKNGN